MAYTNSSMVVYTKLSPNHSGQRTHSIDRITPHCVVGQCTAEGLGEWFEKTSTQASSNYGIDKNGRVGMYVEEKNRSWCSSSNANDQRAVTIECASDNAEPYAMNELAEELEGFDEYELEAFGAMLEYGYATDEALQKVQDGEYMFYDGCCSMAEVAEQYADETGLLNSIPDDLRCYFDF